MTPLWDQLTDAADRLACDGRVPLKDLKTMRAAAVQMQNWFDGNQELREENEAALKRINEQDQALRTLGTVLFEASRLAKNEVTFDAFENSAKDTAAFKNIMELAYGVNSVGGELPVRKARKGKPIKTTGATP